MNAGFYRIKLVRFAKRGEFLLQPGRSTIWRFWRSLLRVSAAGTISFGLGAWVPAYGQPVQLGPATVQPGAAAPTDAQAQEAAGVDGLRISSQSWRRGGLGSKALVTFTLRNDNDYAVKDVEIACSFNGRDGSHFADLRRLFPDTVNMKTRKTFARVPVGFVNIDAIRAKCSLVAARRA
jgi:hypothetical protein